MLTVWMPHFFTTSLYESSNGVWIMAWWMFTEKLRKLKSVDDQADLLWLLYISGDTKDRIETDEIIDILLHEKIDHDFSANRYALIRK